MLEIPEIKQNVKNFFRPCVSVSEYQWIYLRFRTKFNVCSYCADITPLHETRIECFDFLKNDFSCTNLIRDKKYSPFLKTLDFILQNVLDFMGILKKIKKRVLTVVHRDSLRMHLSLNAGHAKCAIS